MQKMLWLLLLTLSILRSVSLAAPGQTEKPVLPAAKVVVIGDFSDRIKAYVRLRTNVEDSFTRLNSSKDSAEIAAHKIELSAMIVAARPDSRQGDVFTPEIAAQFQDILRKTIQAPEAQPVRRTIQDKDVASSIVVRLNITYPEGDPMPTMPPTLLGRLPDLPMDLAYRIIGRSFVLIDNKTRLIIDFIPDALP